ncbi:MAG: hypothetical protein IOD12_04325 [Silvanigrellales bacterium]|nr:hypothetical protein [Silvanigrellales bacterium]
MKNGLKNFAVMLIAAAIGFGVVHLLFRNGQSLRSRNASIVLEVEVRDTKGRPLKNAEVVVRAPTLYILGRTDARGVLRGKVSVERGRSYTVETRGRHFQEARTLVAPWDVAGRASVTFDLGKRALAKARKPTGTKKKSTVAPVPFPVRIDVFSGTGSDKTALLQVVERLKKVASASQKMLSQKGVSSFQIRQLWSEVSYVEIVALGKDGKALGGYLLRTHKTDDVGLAFAMKNMWMRSFRDSAGSRALMVMTSRPSEARAYLNSIPLARKVTRAGAVFDLSNHPSSGTKGAILTLTSDGGPLIRSSVTVAALGQNIRWTLPNSALSKR